MTEHVTEAQQPPSIDTANSSRTSRSAAGWVDLRCRRVRQGAGTGRDTSPDRSAGRARSRSGSRGTTGSHAGSAIPTDDERQPLGRGACGRKENVDPDLIVSPAGRTTRRWSRSWSSGIPGEGDDSQYHVLRPLYATAGGHGVHLHRKRRSLPGRRHQRVRREVLLPVPGPFLPDLRGTGQPRLVRPARRLHVPLL